MGVIFISHSSKNNDEAVAVRDWLVSEGWGPSQIFIDISEFASGDRWRDMLNKVGETCEAIIVCLSDDWLTSPECLREFNHAESAGKPIFPVVVRPITEPIPRFITDVQFVDLSRDKNEAYDKLRLGLHRARISPEHFSWPPPDEPDRSPYRGLQALTEKDAAVFFGRDAQITLGLDTLRQIRDGAPRRILTIAAASGAGKSSFLKAVLLSRLERDTEGFLVLPTIRPERDAYAGDTGLLPALGLREAPADDQNLKAHLDALQSPVVANLQSLAKAAGDQHAITPPTLVLPIDQAEELFSADNTSGTAAIDLLIRCLAVKPDLLLIATIRSDSLGELQDIPAIANQLDLFSLPAMPPANFKEVIEGPGQITTPPIVVEPALTERLIKDLNDADALPLLAFTMERLVAEYADDNLLELSEYTQGLGGAAGAINSAVEAAFQKCEQDPALPNSRLELDALVRSAFIPWLVQLDDVDASPKRRVAKLVDLPDSSHALIDNFIDERLLVSSRKDGERIVEVSHEAVLRHWRGLAAWIGEERGTLQRLQDVQRASLQWRGDKRDEARARDMLVHRGERLALAEALLERPDMKRALKGDPEAYLKACRAAEDAAIEHEQRQQRRRRSLQRWVGVVTMAAIAITLAGAFFVIKGQKDLSRSESLVLARMADVPFADNNFIRSTRLSAIAARSTNFGSPAPEAFAALASSSQALKQTTQFHHDGDVRGAAFSKDETRILSWSDDDTVRLWDVEFATRTPSDTDYLANVCARKLRGAPLDTGKINPTTGQPIRKSPRHIDERDIEIAPILRGREGEDACTWSPPWHHAITRPLADFVFD
ncbi:MAG: TIR domain-containing protein [Pseudomonadota bacterium]